VRELIFVNVHGQLQPAALGILRHLKAIELHGNVLFADPEEAADADHKAFDGFGILAEDEIADAADLGFIGSKDGPADKVLGENGIGLLHDDLARDGRFHNIARRRAPR